MHSSVVAIVQYYHVLRRRLVACKEMSVDEKSAGFNTLTADVARIRGPMVLSRGRDLNREDSQQTTTADGEQGRARQVATIITVLPELCATAHRQKKRIKNKTKKKIAMPSSPSNIAKVPRDSSSHGPAHV